MESLPNPLAQRARRPEGEARRAGDFFCLTGSPRTISVRQEREKKLKKGPQGDRREKGKKLTDLRKEIDEKGAETDKFL